MKVLIVSDIHGNWPALQAVLRAEPDADEILCLGDLVNYGPQPVECVQWAMQDLGSEWTVQGQPRPRRGPERRPTLRRAVQAAGCRHASDQRTIVA